MKIRITCTTTSELGTPEVYRLQIKKHLFWKTIGTYSTKYVTNRNYKQLCKLYRELEAYE